MADNTIDLTWTPVVSSHISAYAYDEAAGELYVKFSNGSLYTFLSVPAAIVTAWERAPSAGQYFYLAVKNRYLYRRVLARKG